MPKSGDFDFTYPSKLKAIGITLLDTFIGAKNYHLMECDACKHQWIATPISKIQNFKRWKTGGCPECTKQKQYQDFLDIRHQNILKLEERFEILSKYDGMVGDMNSTALNVNVRNKQCGHTFTSTSKNLLTRDVVCPICNKEEKIKRLNANSKARSVEYHKTADLWDSYRHRVYMKTRSTYHKHKAIINPTNLPRGKAGREGAYHLDHIVPVRWCFEHDVPAEICADHTNLQMLHWNDNVGSRDKLKENIKTPNIFIKYMKG